MKYLLLLGVLILAIGCGPSAQELREQTLSTVNTEADRWNGGNQFQTTALDAYGRPLASKVEKTVLSYVLEVRSFGPDGLPSNSDDIVVTRMKSHGETTLTQEAAKAVETIAESGASGTIKGIKKGLGMGGEKK